MAEESAGEAPRGVRSIIVASNFPPAIGGACQVYAALAEQGRGLVQVLAPVRSFLTGERFSGIEAFDAGVGYRVHRIDLIRPRAGLTGRYARIHDLWVMTRLLVVISWLCLRHGIKVVCIGDLIYAGWLAWPLRRVLRRRVMFYVHGEEMTESAGGLFERWKGAFLRAGDAVLAVSTFARHIAVAKLGVDPGRVVTVLNGVNLETFRQRERATDLAERFGLDSGPVLLTVARLIERKGVDTVLRALPAIAEAVPGVRYLVAGDGPDRPRLTELTEQLGISGRVIFTGRLSTEDLPRIYSLADVFIMPNRRLASGDNEGFGLVFLEANASGLPVIGGKAGGTQDAVLDGETGLLVEGTDQQAVTDAAVRLLRDGDLRRLMTRRGLEFAGSRGWRGRFMDYQRAAEARGDGPLDGSSPERSLAEQVRYVRPARMGRAMRQPDRPVLLAVIDAEEEFDWETYLADAISVSNMRHLGPTSAIYARHGIRPTYMVDYPVASQSEGFEPLRELLAAGACTIGSQLHPWVTPPLTRRVSMPAESYPGNLPEAEERAKIAILTETIERNLGVRPRAYRSGRYGMGPHTEAILRDLGYTIDCSILPCTDLSPQWGPDFQAWTAEPGWLDESAGLLEVPITLGLLGALSRVRWASVALSSPGLNRLRIPGILARLGLLERIKLTPEGTSVEDAKRLTRALMAAGQRVFAITYHTSSLVPGHTSYVRSPAELDRFHTWIDEFCGWFLGEAGGCPGTLDELYDHATGATAAA